jgi:hypothetical protein
MSRCRPFLHPPPRKTRRCRRVSGLGMTALSLRRLLVELEEKEWTGQAAMEQRFPKPCVAEPGAGNTRSLPERIRVT